MVEATLKDDVARAQIGTGHTNFLNVRVIRKMGQPC